MSLYDEIIASGLPLDDHGAIAEALSIGRTTIVSRPIGIGSVLDALGPVAGAQVLDTLKALSEQDRVVYWAWYLLEAGTLDIGLPTSRAQLDELAAGGVMTAAQATALKALAEIPDPVTSSMVTAALEGHE
ncbi:hypothetical protein ACFOON_15115 [Novosphingobium piscinae]|uniref:Uncharacterized protein n=1 Tax=Novosphingobium piscinae TaxID=1507448 RepID=A0A7X1FXM7_9SPHN|nr:hypothetical protein [Novosphingobium piscinae]MBC2668769.1 hypothetical protein [Novosphingobium piscinae]